MYILKNIKTGKTFYTDTPNYVRKDERGVWVNVDKKYAQCIAYGGKRYSIQGRTEYPDAPDILSVYELDWSERLNSTSRAQILNASNIDELKSAVLDIYDAILDIYSEFEN